MEKGKELLDFVITVIEKTSWGLVHKTFNNSIKADRADTIAKAMEYIS
jgi:hypothetical protein